MIAQGEPMVVPLEGRSVAAAVGALLVLTAWSSVIGTLIVPRPVSSVLTRWVDWTVNEAYWLFIGRVHDYKRRDRILATQAAAVLLGQLVAWLGIFFVGFALLLWPLDPFGVGSAFTNAGSSLFTLGFAGTEGAAPLAVVFISAASGLVIVALQVGYLPALYAAFNRRETEVTLLNGRGGVPAWGPELLARTHYALGSGVSTIDTLPDLYSRWERWAADVAESHTAYLALVRFRSPRPLSSWVTSLLSVMDSAALMLSLCPDAAPTVPARLCLRAGFLCFQQIASTMGIDYPVMPDASYGISVTYEEFIEAVNRMREVDFPTERDPSDAWPDFVGWRVNYEKAAYGVATAVNAAPALWSGPRRSSVTPIPPIRPPQ
jgi:hypothetical protein